MAGGGRIPTGVISVGMQVSRLNSDGSRDPNYKLPLDYGAYDGARTLLPHGNLSVGYVPYSDYDSVGTGLLIRSDGSTSGMSVDDENPWDDNWNEIDRVLPVRHSGALIALVKHNILTEDPNDPDSWYYAASYSLTRTTEDGQIDPTFGNNGYLDGYYDLLDTTGDGKILYVMPNGGGVKRLNADGLPDATFGTSGVAGAGYTHFTVDELDRIIAWKTTGTNSADVQIARYTPDGQLDKTFGGGDGIAIVHRPVLGDANVILTPTNGMVVTSVKQTGDVYNWFATRLQGDSGAGMDGSTLRVAGSTNSDKISLVKSGTSIKVTINGVVNSFAISSVKSIQINGNAGDDSITVGNGLIGGASMAVTETIC